MQRLSPPLSAHERPQPPLPVKSFARYDNDPGHAKSPLEDLPNPRYSLESEEGGRVNGLDDQRTSAAFDVFDSSTPVEEQPEAVVQEPHGAHDSVNELPAEIQQMLDRYAPIFRSLLFRKLLKLAQLSRELRIQLSSRSSFRRSTVRTISEFLFSSGGSNRNTCFDSHSSACSREVTCHVYIFSELREIQNKSSKTNEDCKWCS